MVRTFNTLGHETVFSNKALKAHITVIPKEDKNLSACDSYRPISLLNVDLKLFFIPTHEARDNTIKALNLIHLADSFNTPSVFLGTDTAKVFDWVNWSFMFSVL